MISTLTRSAGHRAALLLAFVLLVLPAGALAQDRPSQRQMRTYIPPDQLVSFLPSTPFDQFVEFLNPIFERVAGKQVIDPASHHNPIGISIAGMHFADALELVLEYNGLRYRETDRYFIIEQAPAPQETASPTQLTAAQPLSTSAPRKTANGVELPNLDSREIRINAILFDLNQTKARETGVDWNVLFGSNQSQNSGGGSSGGNSNDPNSSSQPRFFLKTDKIFQQFDEYITSPKQIEFSTLTQLFRLLETEGLGRTVASPQVTVQSGEKGSIQVGTDIPFNSRDFAGNTVTQYLKTGVIVDVTPTLISEALTDSADSPIIDFIHLDVSVDKSSSRPSISGPMIDRNQAQTRVILLNGEQTVIGGLYSTEDVVTRRGIPILKDLPGWFFGLRYIFGHTVKTVAQKELLIVLQAELLDPIPSRASRPLEGEALERARQQIRESLRRVQPGLEKDGPEVK